jgi:flagellar assembly protein FliH
MDSSRSKDRIPYESIDDSAMVSSWSLPTVGSNSRLVKSKKRSDEKTSPSVNEKIETVRGTKKSKPMTVEELSELTETARKEGFQQGLKDGTEQGIREGTKVGEKSGQQRAYIEAKKEIETLQHTLRQLTTRLHEPLEKQDNNIENILVDLALNLAQKIVASEIKTEPSIVLDMVRLVLADIPKSAKNTRISFHPDDAKLVTNLIPENQREWSIISDESLSSGGCIVETDSSLIDYSVESRLASFFEKLNLSKDRQLDPVPDYQNLDPEPKQASEIKQEDVREQEQYRQQENELKPEQDQEAFPDGRDD